jgi:hypothetical protein
MKNILIAMILLAFAAPALAGTVQRIAPNYAPPFGMWRIPVDQLGTLPYNFDGLAYDPSTSTPGEVIDALNKARAAHVHIFLTLVQFGKLQENPPGNFSLAAWQARYDAWCPHGHCLDLDPYVADGTLIGLHIFEYSKPPTAERRLSPDLDQIHQVAAYVKTLWPHVPTIIDGSKPCVFVGRDWSHAVDIMLFTVFTNRWSDYSRGEAVFNRNIACLRQVGMRFFIDPNPFGGAQDGLPAGALPNFVHFAEFSILYPGSLGTAIWRWWPGDADRKGNGIQNFANFWSEQQNPGVGAAMREVEACALQHTPAACPHGGPGG